MGRAKEYLMELQELEMNEERTLWIQEQLNDFEATPSSTGWDEYADIYDQSYDEDLELFSNTPHSINYTIFRQSVNSITSLISISKLNVSLRETLNLMAFSHIITALENYLSNTLISIVLSEDKYIEAYLKLNDLDEKHDLLFFYKTKEPKEFIKSKVYAKLRDYMYHNLPKISSLYKLVLGIKFDYGSNENREKIFKAIQLRHDCVHRNGMGKDGHKTTSINQALILDTISVIETFVENLEAKIEYMDI